jgi:hypothetical protein
MVNASAYPHLLPPAREIALLPAAERMAKMDGHCWIGYPAAQAAIARLESLLAQPPVLRPTNMLIVGPSNNGKSMIAERLRRTHPASATEDGGRDVIPVVIMQMPASPSIRRFYSALLSALGSPVSAYGSVDLREQLALRIMREVGVRLLIIDEIHNMLAGRTNEQREFLNVLRFLGNELRMPLACLGTSEAYLAIRSDDQLENRFEPFSLPRWTDGPTLARLLASFEATLPLREPSKLGSRDVRALILRRSEGTIGEISALLAAAMSLALETGRECIDADLVNAAPYRAPSQRRRQFEASLE